jgi:hypothetical protein
MASGGSGRPRPDESGSSQRRLRFGSKELAYLEGVQYDDTIIVALGIGSAFSFGEEKFVPESCHCSD